MRECSLRTSHSKPVGRFFGAKSLFCWQRLGIPLHQVQVSTLIQPIPAAIAAGTLQLVNDQIEIHATLGLGMPIARGEVIPDKYQVAATEGTIRETIGHENHCLSLGGKRFAANSDA